MYLIPIEKGRILKWGVSFRLHPGSYPGTCSTLRLTTPNLDCASFWGVRPNGGEFRSTSGELHWDPQPTPLGNPKSEIHPFSGYRRMGEWVPHMTINHKERFAEGLIHVNTLEGFWSMLKRAIAEQHHHYSKQYAAYIVEGCWKDNNRNAVNLFDSFLTNAMQV